MANDVTCPKCGAKHHLLYGDRYRCTCGRDGLVETDAAEAAQGVPMPDRKTLWQRLLDYYTEDEALRWLTSPQPLLQGAIPAVALASSGDPEPFHRLLDTLDAGVYL